MVYSVKSTGDFYISSHVDSIWFSMRNQQVNSPWFLFEIYRWTLYGFSVKPTSVVIYLTWQVNYIWFSMWHLQVLFSINFHRWILYSFLCEIYRWTFHSFLCEIYSWTLHSFYVNSIGVVCYLIRQVASTWFSMWNLQFEIYRWN